MKKIYVIADERNTQNSVTQALEKQYEVYCFSSVSEAAKKIDDDPPNLLLIDISMPEIDEKEILDQIKNLNTAPIPVVFLTDALSSEMESHCFALGAQDFIRKPFSGDVLRRRIDRVLSNIEVWQHLQRDVDYDALTGLRSRACLERVISAHLSERDARGVFLMMDLDHFKLVNDYFGHITGDRILQCFAKVLKTHVRGGDIVGRLGGDEFVAYLPGADNNPTILRRCEQLQADAKAAFRDVLGEKGRMISLSVSIGGAVAPKNGKSFQDLYHKADIALYRVKRHGRGSCYFSEDTMDTVITPDLIEKHDTLRDLKNKIGEPYRSHGTFNVSYDDFRSIYQLMERRRERTDVKAQLVLFTLVPADDGARTVDDYETILAQFCLMVNNSLRRGDVTTRYGLNQQITLLSDTAKENGAIVAERIENAWCGLHTGYNAAFEIRDFPL